MKLLLNSLGKEYKNNPIKQYMSVDIFDPEMKVCPKNFVVKNITSHENYQRNQ